MLNEVFSFFISMISKWFDFVFNLEINKNPPITLGMFLLACALIGLLIYFVLGTDFIPGISFTKNISSSKNNNNNYQPRHAPGTAGRDFSTRESRHKY